MRLQPGIAKAPWTILNRIWMEELGAFSLDPLAIIDIDRVDPSAFPTIARESKLPPSALEGLTIPQQREVLKFAVLRKRLAGTPWALEKAVNALGFDDATVTEWFDQSPKGDPFTFAVELAMRQRGPTPEDWPRAIRSIVAAKNRRSWFSSIRIAVKTQSVTPYLASFASSVQAIRILPFITTEIERRPPLWLAPFARSGMCVRILPQGAV